MDFIDGAWVEPRRVTTDEVVVGTHQGSVEVAAGVRLDVRGTIQGTVAVGRDATVAVRGTIHGTVSVASGAVVEVSGSVQGTVQVDAGGLVRVESAGSLQGTLHVDGSVENHGARGGAVSGMGSIVDAPGSRVAVPRIVDGVHIYEW